MALFEENFPSFFRSCRYKIILHGTKAFPVKRNKSKIRHHQKTLPIPNPFANLEAENWVMASAQPVAKA